MVGSIRKLLTVAVALLGSVAGVVDARMLDYHDADRVANAVTADLVRDELLSAAIENQLSNHGLPEAQQRLYEDRIKKRLVSDIRAYSATLNGRSYASIDEARTDVEARLRVIRYSAMSDPKGFANGRKASYVVTSTEAARLRNTLVATYIERESSLRARLQEMILMEEMDRADMASVRILARETCVERGRTAITDMMGAPFFSASDAELYLEYAVDAELDGIRAGKLGEPMSRQAFIEEARSRFPGGVSPSASLGTESRIARRGAGNSR